MSVAFEFDSLFDIPGVDRDASAITVHSETGHLWVITDDRVRMVEFTDQGELVREVKLTGFDDTEGLCHVDGNRFLIAEEKQMCITLIEVPTGAVKIKAEGRRIPLDVKAGKKNKGLEGVAYDPASDTLFAVREDKPPTVYCFHPLLAGGSSTTSEWSLDLHGLDDLSDVFFDARTNWLWLLSHESQAAAAFDPQGVRVVELQFTQGSLGLPEDIPQAEGIVRDHRGRLFICSEPNRIYCFRPIA